MPMSFSSVLPSCIFVGFFWGPVRNLNLLDGRGDAHGRGWERTHYCGDKSRKADLKVRIWRPSLVSTLSVLWEFSLVTIDDLGKSNCRTRHQFMGLLKFTELCKSRIGTNLRNHQPIFPQRYAWLTNSTFSVNYELRLKTSALKLLTTDITDRASAREWVWTLRTQSKSRMQAGPGYLSVVAVKLD